MLTLPVGERRNYGNPKNALAKKAAIWALVTVLFGRYVPSGNPVVMPNSNSRFIYLHIGKLGSTSVKGDPVAQ